MGWETAAFVEWEDYPQKVLAKNFPEVPIYKDIRDFKYEQAQVGPIDIVSGGFPCQPFSTAGKRQGTTDDRYLWPEMLRVIREVQPTWVVGENVAGLFGMDGGKVFEEVCSSLEGEGYAVQSFIIPAISKGAPHRRDRIWIVANASITRTRVCHQKQKTGRQKRSACESSQPKVVRFSDGKTDAERVESCNLNPSNTRHSEPQGRIHPKKIDNRSRKTWEQAWSELASCDSIITNWREGWHEVATRLCRVGNGLPPGWTDIGPQD
jgi:DNA-cytosine methyltransferase